jgi:putative flippase GtrA
MLINLATQWLCFHVYSDRGELMVGIAAGTLTGLASKFALDKFWIFSDRSLRFADNLRKFTVYSLTGVFTTAIFWTTESTFALLTGPEAMRYWGAIIGLLIGYVVKFRLDRRFVFRGAS